MTDDTQTPTIHAQVFTLGHYLTNCYLIHDEQSKEGWIVDCSWGPAPMIQAAKDLGLKITKIILTHAHIDHLAGIDEVRRAFPDAAVYLHEDEAGWMGDPEKNLSAGHGQPFRTQPADVLLKDGQTLDLGTTTWTVHHTPGHSPGSVTLHCPGIGAAIVGDVLFHRSIGRADFPTSNYDELKRSIVEKLYRFPDDTVCLPGHNDRTTIGDERRYNPFVPDPNLDGERS
jgi:glyoxylase-like metal-dependent hydrolase (beta-lactamase superfamily II)